MDAHNRDPFEERGPVGQTVGVAEPGVPRPSDAADAAVISGYLEGVRTLRGTGRHAEALAVLREAIERFPGTELLELEKVRIVISMDDWPLMLAQWREFEHRLPEPISAGSSERRHVRTELCLHRPGFDRRLIDLEPWVCGCLISEDPIIILAAGLGYDVAERTAEYYRGRIVYYFIGMAWSLSADPTLRQKFADGFHRLSELHPNLKITVLANDATELLILRDLKVRSELINHNFFLDENIFRILPEEQTHDAVYVARVNGYKRHELAELLDTVLLNLTAASADDLHKVKAMLPNCTIANEVNGQPAELPVAELVRYLNRARTGLCLSALEGGMLSSMEYLLCGLPVVTTHNAGGRNWFFGSDYVMFCDDTPEAVRDAVQRTIAANIPRRLVRENALQRINRERLAFFALVDAVYRENGQADRRFGDEFPKLFYDKMNVHGHPIGDFLVPFDCD